MGTRRPHVALVGMMGAGKTTVGRLVALRTDRRFVDTDDLIEEATGRSPRELWEAGGEAAYRPLELDAVRHALGAEGSVVLAVPGGVAIDPAMARAVQGDGVVTVFLRASLATLDRRVGDGPAHRPLLGDDPEGALRSLLDERAGLYEAIADAVVDVDDLAPQVVADSVVALAG